MRFSENWLRTLVDPKISSADLARVLTMAGLEVEALQSVAPVFTEVVVGEVLSVEKHPGADRLSVCRVSVGQAEPLTIVCGAPNVAPGVKAPCARVGARLPGTEIRETQVRGVTSSGMLCSAKELGLTERADGLLLLPPNARPGADVREYLELDDSIFGLKLTPNRGDCLSVLGVAREVAAITATSLNFPSWSPVKAQTEQALPVRVAAPEACPLYCGRVILDVDVGRSSPVWLTRRLERSGVRSHDAVVDATNYVMLELGQPLHAFDLSEVEGEIVVRYGAQGEILTLINGEQIELDPGYLVIADEKKALALAGIMGGEASAVRAETRHLFLESAFFAPEAIAGRSRRLGFGTDSSHRFERGVDFAMTRNALERVSALILEVCGGKAGPITQASSTLPQREPIALRLSRLARVLGVNLSETDVGPLLRRLHFSFTSEDRVLYVLPQTYRFDLKREDDLIEELARIYGYDRIPATLPKTPLQMLPAEEAERSPDSLRAILSARDYQEIITYSFVDPAWEADLAGNLNPVVIKNPLSRQMSAMRSSLAGGLLDCLRQNLNRKQPRARVFELGRCFLRSAESYAQPERLAALCYGDAYPEQWGIAPTPTDFYDVKADVEALFAPACPAFEPAPHPALHPGKSARIIVEGKIAGWLGELHPKWQQKYELPSPPVFFELDLKFLLKRVVPATVEVSKFPPVRRDLAVVVAQSIPAEALLAAMREAAPPAASEIWLFDVYQGKGIPSGKKSLAFRVLLQDTRKTLTESEVDSAVTQLIEVLKHRFDASLRGEGESA
jgi:phenylalanyl-tRNA synthetase beta chain